jgi:hypothetical protein
MLNKQNYSDSLYVNSYRQAKKFLDKNTEGLQSFRSAPLLEGLSLVLIYHDCPYICVESFLEAVLPQLCGLPESSAIKREKFLTVYPMALLLRFSDGGLKFSDLPVGEPFKFKNPFKNWFKSRTNAYNDANVHLWYSFLQAKRCAAPLSDEIVWEKYLAHRTLLSQPDTLKTEMRQHVDEHPGVVDQEEDRFDFSNAIEKASRSFDWDRVRRGLSSELRAPIPSPSASYGATRAAGGQSSQVRYLLESDCPATMRGRFEEVLLGLMPESSARSVCLQSRVTSDVVASYRPWQVVDGIKAFNSIIWDYGHDCCFETLIELLRSTSTVTLPAEIKAVLEPLKCRIISCGSGPHYYGVKTVQRELWQGMQNSQTFRLTSGPVSTEDLEWVRRGAELGYPRCLVNGDDMVYKVGGKWVSVDYEAATDNSSQLLGMALLRRLLAKCPSDLAWILPVCEQVFGKHSLFYSQEFESDSLPHEVESWDGRRLSRRETDGTWSYLLTLRKGRELKYRISRSMEGLQQNGQLMGSILSFPILCWMNYLTWTVLSRHLRDHPEWDGMDAYNKHIEVAGGVGLKMSRGKAYVHPMFANVNSTCFTERGGRVREISYLNVALMLGKHKVQVDQRKPKEEDALEEQRLSVAHWNKVQAGLFRGRHESFAWRVFRENHEKNLDQLSEGWRSYHLPTSFGGLGLNFDQERETTPHQRAAVRLRLEAAHLQGFWLDVRPTRGPEVRSELTRLRNGHFVNQRVSALDELAVAEVFGVREFSVVRRALNRCPRLGRRLRHDRLAAAVLCHPTPRLSAHGVSEGNISKTVPDRLNSSVPTGSLKSSQECRETARKFPMEIVPLLTMLHLLIPNDTGKWQNLRKTALGKGLQLVQ